MHPQRPGNLRALPFGLIFPHIPIGSYIFTYLVTYAQDTLHLSARAGFIAETLGNALGIPVILLGGRCSDRVGRWPINVWRNLVFLVMIYPIFAWITFLNCMGLHEARRVAAIVPQ